ncbi:DUF1289 domain-containing protein [Leptospira ellisii]|nr:DUF1289 domain-containing protein [Leptospira ellisii]PKA05940.1 DUF1289 domain-containing protein [Leptospira ellisii]
MDFETGYCEGCFRTLEEIGNWSRYSDEERESVYSRIKDRREERISGKRSE